MTSSLIYVNYRKRKEGKVKAAGGAVSDPESFLEQHTQQAAHALPHITAIQPPEGGMYKLHIRIRRDRGNNFKPTLIQSRRVGPIGQGSFHIP